MRRITHPIASTAMVLGILLSGFNIARLSIHEGSTLVGCLVGLLAVAGLAGLLPIYLRATIQEWQEYMRSEDE